MKSGIIRSTKILCNRCKEKGIEEYLVVAPGWESKEALECPNCKNYHYFIGFIYCCNNDGHKDELPLRYALGMDFPCGCKIYHKDDSYGINYCPYHKIAPKG